MASDIDAQKIKNEQLNKAASSSKSSEDVEDSEVERIYNQHLKRAMKEDLTDISMMNIIYQCGTDFVGRSIVVIVASNLPDNTNEVFYDRLLLYLIKLLHRTVDSDYVVVFFNTDVGKHKLDLNWFRKAYKILIRKYKKNLKRLFVVHPTWWMRMALWFSKPFVSNKFWEKVLYVDQLSVLFQNMNPSAINIPDSIYKYDYIRNGRPKLASQTLTNSVSGNGKNYQNDL